MHSCAENNFENPWVKSHNNVGLQLSYPLLKSQKKFCFILSGIPVEQLKPILETKLLCMKKINTLLKNDSVQAAIVITTVFLVIALVTFFALY